MPSARVTVATQLPELSAVVTASVVVPSKTVTEALASAVPAITGEPEFEGDVGVEVPITGAAGPRYRPRA